MLKKTRRGSWSKTDLNAAKAVLYDLVESLRTAAVLLKPFLPKTAEAIYRSFNFPQPWEQVRHEDVWSTHDRRTISAYWRRWEDGKVKPLLPRIS